MKNLRFYRALGLLTVVGLLASALPVLAQDATTAPTVSPAPAAAVSQPSTIVLSPDVDQVAQLGRAKVGDSTVIAFIKNSGASYSLTADQIIYLKQQGISDAVLNVMLTQPKGGAVSQTVAASAPAVTSTAVVAPATTTVYVPSTTYYYTPAYYGGGYYPYSYYGWGYPGVSLSFGYRGGWGGGGWHGGGGGWHGGHR